MSVEPSQLEEINARFRGVIDAAVDGIILIDEHGVIETFNPGGFQGSCRLKVKITPPDSS